MNFNSISNQDNTQPNEKERYIEIDVGKGIAVLLMMFFHYFYLGKHMNILNVNTDKGLLYLCAKFAHTTFIIASGVNLAISTSGKSSREYVPKKVKRGLYLFGVGLIISYLTKMEFGDLNVKFGIMHFLGFATILSTFLMKLPILTYFISASILLIHFLLKTPSFKNKFMNICEKNPFMCFVGGIMNIKYNSLDHFGLIPHLGYFLLGSAIAFTCYKIKTVTEEMANISETELATQSNNTNILFQKITQNNTNTNTNTQSSRKYAILGFLDDYKDHPLVKGIAWIGKRSMMFYIVHFTILYCVFKIIQINKINVIK
jgi:uncharacterized membrane protein